MVVIGELKVNTDPVTEANAKSRWNSGMELGRKHWLLHPVYLGPLAVLLVLVGWLSLRLLRRRRRKLFFQLRDPLRAHCWQATQFLDKPTYCNSCTQMCFSGSFCVACGLCTCTESDCIKMASNSRVCKPMGATTTSADKSSSHTQHLWVRGNLPLYSMCFKCLAPCGNLPRLADYRCVWCQKTAHDDCVEDMDVGVCSLGPHQNSIIPPSSVTLSLEGWRGRRRSVAMVTE